MTAELETRDRILAATKQALLEIGFARLSTRSIAEKAGVPLSQIHYHFGSKQNLVLELLDDENQRLLARQSLLYQSDAPLWKQWEQACDYLDDDLASGYVRVLNEMIAAGWSDDEIAAAVRDDMRGWYDLLTTVAERVEERMGGLGTLTPREVASLAGLAFIGTESMVLLGMPDKIVPARSALRKVGDLLRIIETGES